MPFPPQYNPTKDFSQDEAVNATGRSMVNTTALDAEFANISTSTKQINENLQVIQRDDNELRDYLIKPRMLSDATRALISGGWNPRGTWQPGVAYAVRDFVEHNAMCYVCALAHTSNTFTAEVSFWLGVSSVADVVALTERAETAAGQAATSAVAANGSASAAATSATNAANSAASITGSVTAAANSALLAEQHRTAAATSATNADGALGAHVENANAHRQYAPLSSPALTGTPTAPTPTLSDNSTKLATTAFIQSALYGGQKSKTITVNGSFTVPDNVATIYVSACAAGGGGGGGGGKNGAANLFGGGGAGGSAGQAIIRQAFNVTPGQVIPVTIGGAGSGGLGGGIGASAMEGAAGGDTKIGNLIALGGGSGGRPGGAATGGPGGVNLGTTGYPLGSDGSDGGQSTGSGNGGAGASTPFGGGGGRGRSGSGGGFGGYTAGGFGAGGGGGGGAVVSGASVGGGGGAGAPGIVIIEW